MALPTVADVKGYLRVETTAEDTLLGQLLTRAKALIEGELGYALTAVSRSHVNYEESDNYGQRARLAMPGPFKATSPAPVVTDADSAVVSAADYIADSPGLQILAARGICFPNRPYTVVADVGLSAHPDYAAKLEGIVSVAIIDLVVHLYQNRSLGINNESDEGGTARTFSSIGSPALIPKRVMDSIDSLPGRNGGMILS